MRLPAPRLGGPRPRLTATSPTCSAAVTPRWESIRADSADRVRILEHMREIAAAFSAGDFSVPGFVHAVEVPGAAVMAARRMRISYVVESLPRGAAVRLTTGDSSAIEAIHEFLAFQRRDHRAETHHGE